MGRGRRLGMAAVVGAALALAGCGGDDDGGEEKDGGQPASTMRCLTLSVLSPEPYDASGDGVEKGVKPLLTRGAKGAEILTGKVAAVVIEYPDEAAAEKALDDARASGDLSDYAEPEQIEVIERTLFIDYSREPEVRQVVEACARNPGDPPPTPS